MAIDFAKMKKKKDQIMTDLADAVKSGDIKKIETAFDSWQQFCADAVRNEAAGITASADNQILAARGLRPLTSKETEYYNKVIDAMRSENPQASIANIPDAFPETTIDTVLQDLENDHPLLDLIDFRNTSGLTNWLINTKGVQTAIWGPIGSEITKELEGSIEKIPLGQVKLTAFFQVEKDMLDLGPAWIDRYIRAILTDALAVGLESGVVSGDGKNSPIGMIRDLDGSVQQGVYPKKTAITVTGFSPAEYGDLIAELAVVKYGEGEEDRIRDVDGLIMVVNPLDYFKLVMPATTIQTPDGKYVNDVLPYPTKIVKSSAITRGEAVLGIGKKFSLCAGVGKNGKIEYSDEFKFLDDIRTYKIKLLANGRPCDNTSFILLDISALSPAFYTVRTVNEVGENP